ncbi:MAG: peptidylprolyl isomerase [Deltaproteobacteria bacterium]|nr:peptidylprolyl isomerase [Deltaproteobacteria bacterium]
MSRICCALITFAAAGCAGPQTPPAHGPVAAEVLARSSAADWRDLDPERTLVFDSAAGRVVIELAPRFAPVHVANIVALATAGFWDGAAVVRVQDNYVVQWGDPTEKKDLGAIVRDPPAEYYAAAQGAPFTPLDDGDVYAARAGWTDGMPAARDATQTQSWMVHCYGVVGVGRDMPPNTGTGAELYAVIGHAPRHLDRNLALVGRVIAGLEQWAALPRGTGPMGFYEATAPKTPIARARMASALPEAERPKIQLLRTDTATWAAWVHARKHRREPFFVEAAGRVDVCNVPIPTRPKPQGP